MYYLNNETVAVPSAVNFASRDPHSSTLELKTVAINPDGKYQVNFTHFWLD